MDNASFAPRQVSLTLCHLFSPGMELRATSADAAAAIKKSGVDLIPYVQNIAIYESIFDNTLSGEVTVLEDVGLIEYVPIVGAEIVWIAFRVVDENGKDQSFARAFRVVRVGDIVYPRHGLRLYTIELATHEFVTSVSSRICRSFRGKSCSDAVTTILTDDLKVPKDRIKLVENTYGTMDATIPNYTPLQAINYFTMLAQTVKTPKESNFLFYETLDGFWFRSIKSMIEAAIGKPLKKFEFSPGAISGGAVEDSVVRNSLTRAQQETTFDLLTDIAGGMLRSKMVHFDFLARRVAHVEDSRYTETFKTTTHLAKFPLYPQNYDLGVSKNTRIFSFPSNAWSANSSYFKSIEAQPVQNMWESIVLRNRQLREIQHVRSLIDTPGQPDLRAGVVVDVRYPSNPVLQGETNPSVTTSHPNLPTPYYSGPHLITSVKHVLKMRSDGALEYRMEMRVCRDSLSAPLIGTTNTTGA